MTVHPLTDHRHAQAVEDLRAERLALRDLDRRRDRCLAEIERLEEMIARRATRREASEARKGTGA